MNYDYEGCHVNLLVIFFLGGGGGRVVNLEVPWLFKCFTCLLCLNIWCRLAYFAYFKASVYKIRKLLIHFLFSTSQLSNFMM